MPGRAAGSGTGWRTCVSPSHSQPSYDGRTAAACAELRPLPAACANLKWTEAWPGRAVADATRKTCSVSDAARRHVAEDLAVAADEDDTVSGGVAFIPFQFLVGDRNTRPFWDDTLAVGDDGHVFVTADFE